MTKRKIFLAKQKIFARRKDILAWWALWLRRRGHSYQQIADMTGTYRGRARERVGSALAIERRRTYIELRILRRKAESELRLVRAWQAYEMRYVGFTYKRIGDKFQISRERARQIVIGECCRRCRINSVHWRGLEFFEESLND
jgi:hypothetical protein